MTDLDHEKKIAALEAVKYVEDGMVVGLGTGSTAQFMIRALGERVLTGLKIQGIPSSKATGELALECGIPLISLEKGNRIDITIDGADEFDPYLQLIKGGGGALLHEKILAYNSDLYIIIADSKKQVDRLGAFKLPVETIPLATYIIIQTLTERGFQPILRKNNGEVFITQEGNHIIDLDIHHITNLTELERNLKQIPGIVETGLFLHMADIIIMGKEKETVIWKLD